VNKNTTVAFALILLTFILFSLYESNMAKKAQQKPISSVAVKAQVKKESESLRSTATDIDTVVHGATMLGETAIDTSKQDTTIGDTIWVDNGKIVCGIAEKGARIVALRMKDYGYDRNGSLKSELTERINLVGRTAIGGGNLVIDAENFDTRVFKAQDTARHISVAKGQTMSVVFRCPNALGTAVTKQYTFTGDSYRIGLEILSPSLDGKSVTVGWDCGITESEYLKGNAGQNNIAYVNEQRKVHLYAGNSIEHIQAKKSDEKIDPKTGSYKWAAITSKYFVVALVADTSRSADIAVEGYDSKAYDNVKPVVKKGEIVDYAFSIRRIGEGTTEAYWFYAGPGKLSLLRSYRIGLEKVLFGGWVFLLRADIWFPYICEFLLWLLVYVNNLVKDYGVTIIVLTLITRIITYPLSQSSMRSMNRMKMLQPKINHIRERYKSSPKKMNQEMMNLYREEGINPLNPGCLPMFLQMPVLFALYVVLQKAIELRGAQTILIPWVQDLSQPEILIPLKGIPGFSSIFPDGIPMYGYGIALMPIVMAVLTFIQNKMTIKDPNQKAMVYFMPIFMLVLFNSLPAGLVFYWTVSNALGIFQQFILNKSMEKEAATYQARSDKKVQTGKMAKK
jgi:YidC/Oxa1 family membrane protein insertase